MSQAIEVIERAFISVAEGRVEDLAPTQLEFPATTNEVHVKGAWIQDSAFFAIKVACGFYSNASIGLVSGPGLMLVHDATTGYPIAVLLDNGFLTDLRTGAAGGVAAKYLAPADVRRVGVIGAGNQARYQIRALAAVRELKEIAIWSPHRERAERCANQLAREIGVAAYATECPEEAVRGSNVVITTTPSHRPIVESTWVGPGTHITAVGADSPEKQELTIDTVSKAERRVADSLDQCLQYGELHHAIAAGAIDRTSVTLLGDIACGKQPSREYDEQITLCDLTGLGVQDAAIAVWALETSLSQGSGLIVSNPHLSLVGDAKY